MTRSRGSVLALTAALAVAGLAACSASSDSPGAVLEAMEARQKAATAAATAGAGPAAAAAKPACTPDAAASYPKLDSLALPSGSLQAAIKARGTLVVGVSGDTLKLGAWADLKDAEPKGFDIDIAKAIGQAIFGEPGHVTFKVITAAQRFPQVNAGADQGGVDLVARAVSMTCGRWSDPDPAKGALFSVAYLESDQRLLVRTNATVKSLDELVKVVGGKPRVCAPNASTSLANIQANPQVTAVPVAIHSDCLALFQEGRVDAITGDDVILAGFQAQDRDEATILGGKALDTTPYGLAISRQHPEFVQYVNAVMATDAFRSAWQKAYADHLSQALSSAPKRLPEPNYGRPLPAGAAG